MGLIEVVFPLPRSIASVYVAHNLYKWSGHPRPRSALLLTYAGAQPFELISKEGEDLGYTWRLALPTSDECKDQKDKMALCKRIRDALLVMYFAGCPYIGERDALLVREFGHIGQQVEELAFATHASCFNFSNWYTKQ